MTNNISSCIQKIHASIKKITSRIKKHKKSNIHTIIVVIGIIMIWRGVRGILDTFLLPNHPLLSYIIGILMGIGIIYADDNKVDELGHH